MLKENTLPAQVDPFRFADKAVGLEGIVYIQTMQRLAPSLHTQEGEIKVDIEFGVDKQGVRYLKGQLTGCLMLQCQRCLEPFGYDVDSRFMSGIVRSEEEGEQLPKGYDQLVITDELLNVQDVIEDELIINLPVVPMHQVTDCKVKLPLEIKTDEVPEVEKENPFKVIQFLKERN